MSEPVYWSEYALAENFVHGAAEGWEKYGDFYHECHCNMIYGKVTGFVYFAAFGRAPDFTHIKIGYTSKNPYARLAALQTGCPHRLKIVGFVFGNQSMERDIHERLKDHRCEGEWFELSSEVARVIADLVCAPAP